MEARIERDDTELFGLTSPTFVPFPRRSFFRAEEFAPLLSLFINTCLLTI